MKRFFLHTIEENQKACIITGPEAGHIIKVMRMREGDRLILMDHTGKRFQAKIVSSKSDRVTVNLEKELPSPPASPVEIIICQSILKSRAMDYLIQKTSELGVGTIIPFMAKTVTIAQRYMNSSTNFTKSHIVISLIPVVRNVVIYLEGQAPLLEVIGQTVHKVTAGKKHLT